MPSDLDWLGQLAPLRGVDLDQLDAGAVVESMKYPRRQRRRQAGWVTLGIGVTAAAVVLCLLAVGVWAPSRPAAAAVTVVQHDGAFIVTIREPLATSEALARAFREHHVDISVRLIPVSPSEVGQIITFEGPGGADIHPVATPGCPIGSPACPITLSISHIVGHSSVVVGRSARAGEHYASAAGAFFPGEVLHCSGLLNATVAKARAYLSAHHLVGTFRPEPRTHGNGTPSSTTSTTDASVTAFHPASSEYVVNGIAVSSRRIELFVSLTKLSGAEATAREGGTWRGCLPPAPSGNP